LHHNERSLLRTSRLTLVSAGQPAISWLRVAAPAVVVLLAVAHPLCAHGQPPAAIDRRQEYNVKAAYLYSFGRYVAWPEESISGGEPFTIGVLGSDPFGGALDRIAERKQVFGKRIVIRRFQDVDDYQPCHILFVPKTVSAQEQTSVMERIGQQPVLLAGEIPGFAERGGTVNFFLSGGTVRFEINVDAVKQRGLRVDAKLLSLARPVKSQ
jgi:hypothetical protein